MNNKVKSAMRTMSDIMTQHPEIHNDLLQVQGILSSLHTGLLWIQEQANEKGCISKNKINRWIEEF